MFVKDGLDWRFVPISSCFAEEEGQEESGGGEGQEEQEASEEGGEEEPVDWRSLITDPENQKEAERSTDLDALVKRVRDMRTQLSSSIKVPGKDASDEDIAAFDKAIGVPDSTDDYVFPEIPEEQLTDDVKAFRADWAETFHSLKIPKDAAEKLAAKFHEQNLAAEQAQIDADKSFLAEQDETLKKKWPGDEFKRNKELARRAIENLAQATGLDAKDLANVEMKSGRFLLDDANILQLFATAGSQMDSGTLGEDLTDADRDSIQEQIQEIRKGIQEAQKNRDRKKANRLYQEEQELIGKLKAA